ncbi:hypothetical protein ACFWBR_37835 [Streptomyces sp. NPDC060006]|uniref:hypothetical protein n=1 Tax=unclassified Streptomyces TaxID=2593676 RepID=UPI0036AA146E
MTTKTPDQTPTESRRRCRLRRLATAALYAVVRGAAATAGSALITEIIWMISHR